MDPELCPTHELANTQNPNTIHVANAFKSLLSTEIGPTQ